MARLSWREAKQLDSSLASLDGFFASPPEYAQTLTGGLTNRCWKVVLPTQQAFVWRPVTPITQAFSISRHQEFQILKAIEHSGIAPKPVYLCDQGLLVEWVEGQSLTDQLDTPNLLKCLSQIHGLDAERVAVAPFNYTARVDNYWIQIESKLKTELVTGLYQQWRVAPNIAELPHALCHFDLAGYNMVQTPSNKKVIDWEYATIADPRLDLAISLNIVGEAELTPIFEYCKLRQLDGVDDWVEGVKAWLPRIKLMSLLWYLLAYQLWGENYYHQQAESLLSEFFEPVE